MDTTEEYIQTDDFGPGDRSRSTDGGRTHRNGLIRLQKTVVFAAESGRHIDESFVNHHFYDHFKYSLLPKEYSHGKLTLGITSANAGEGKSIVAANLAASLAMANQRETVLVDLNISRPRIHEIFGAPIAPGLLDGMRQTSVTVTKTKINYLSVLPIGSVSGNPIESIRVRGSKPVAAEKSPVRLEQLSDFRTVLASLEEQFELVIIDLPSIHESIIPTIFTTQLSGVIVVVDAGKTKQQDIDRLLVTLNESQVLGFVFNRANH
jgi:Mrp family chromosome partitioning ATPase